jgi:hypothetical protein
MDIPQCYKLREHIVLYFYPNDIYHISNDMVPIKPHIVNNIVSSPWNFEHMFTSNEPTKNCIVIYCHDQKFKYKILRFDPNSLRPKTVIMKQKYVIELVKILLQGKDIVPFQSSDMKKQGIVRFADRIEFNDFLIAKHKAQEYQRSHDKYGYGMNLTSDIDFFKMKRAHNPMEYIYEMDPAIMKHYDDIWRFVDTTISKEDIFNDKFVFLPHVDYRHGYQFNTQFHGNIVTVNDVDFIKTLTSDNMYRGKVLYNLFILFDTFVGKLSHITHEMNEGVHREEIQLTTYKDLTKHLTGIEYQRQYGVTQEGIRLVARQLNETKEKYKLMFNKLVSERILPDKKYTLADCNKLKHDYIQKLNGYDVIKYDMKIDLERMFCEYQIIDFSEVNDINDCRTGKFATDDFYEHSSYAKTCSEIAKLFEDSKIKDTISRELAGQEEIISKTRIFYGVDANKIIEKGFTPNEFYMPEWSSHMQTGDVKQAFEYRQLIIADTTIANFFRQCTRFWRSEPFVSQEHNVKGLIYDVETNKMMMACIASSDMIFPIRIVDCKPIENLYMYRSMPMEGKRLLGTLITRLHDGERFEFPRYYLTHIYDYLDGNKMRLVNYKGNSLTFGTLYDFVRSLYIELNVLMYYNDDIGRHIGIELHFYKYIYGDTYDIYVSKHNPHELADIYSRSYSHYNEHLENLIEVRIEKDMDKRFYFPSK